MEDGSAKFGLHVSWAKTKIQNLGISPAASDIIVNHQVVSGVREFTYLGYKFCTDTNSMPGCLRRIALDSGVIHDLDEVWKRRKLSLTTKIRIYLACVASVVLYSWKTMVPIHLEMV